MCSSVFKCVLSSIFHQLFAQEINYGLFQVSLICTLRCAPIVVVCCHASSLWDVQQSERIEWQLHAVWHQYERACSRYGILCSLCEARSWSLFGVLRNTSAWRAGKKADKLSKLTAVKRTLTSPASSPVQEPPTQKNWSDLPEVPVYPQAVDVGPSNADIMKSNAYIMKQPTVLMASMAVKQDIQQIRCEIKSDILTMRKKHTQVLVSTAVVPLKWKVRRQCKVGKVENKFPKRKQ